MISDRLLANTDSGTAADGSQLRFCPRCGRSLAELLCPDDNTPTFRQAEVLPGSLVVTAGTVVSGRYQVANLLGRGGFGAVYQARHVITGQDVALKVLSIDVQVDGIESMRRFFKEAQVTAALRHANTVRVYDFGQMDNGALFMAMELLVGPTIGQLLAQRRTVGEALSELEACEIAIGCLRGLAEAHSVGLVHRDIKPANIMLARVSGDEPVVKLLDFGIARTSHSSLTGRKILGTPAYMSPEQCMGQQLTAHSDLYSLGVVIFEAVTGQPPFDAQNPLSVMFMHNQQPMPEARVMGGQPVSAPLTEVLRRAMHKSPGERYEDARAMRKALEDVRDRATRRTGGEGPADGSSRANRPSSGLLRKTLGDLDAATRSSLGLAELAAPTAANSVQFADTLTATAGIGELVAAQARSAPAPIQPDLPKVDAAQADLAKANAVPVAPEPAVASPVNRTRAYSTGHDVTQRNAPSGEAVTRAVAGPRSVSEYSDSLLAPSG